MDLTAECALEVEAALGEGPVWDPIRRVCWWVDITAGVVHRFDPATRTNQSIALGSMVGSVALCADGRLLVAARAGIVVLDPESGAIVPSGIEVSLADDVRFNDGKCDGVGRFWVGTMAVDASRGRGALYCAHPGGGVEVKLVGSTISNGLAWDTSSQVMYYADSATGCVFAFDYEEESGAISNQRVALRVPPAEGLPDGITIDRDGMLWVAIWGGFGVSRWDPRTGERIGRVRVPAAHVTSCTFGGPRLDQLFITTARAGLGEQALARQPLAGSVFSCSPGVLGFEPACFAI